MNEDPAPYGEAKIWRGKVRIFERVFQDGSRDYSARYRLNWWSDWQHVESGPGQVLKGAGGRRLDILFPTFEAAKTAAQLKWNDATEEQRKLRASIPSAWRKIWP